MKVCGLLGRTQILISRHQIGWIQYCRSIGDAKAISFVLFPQFETLRVMDAGLFQKFSRITFRISIMISCLLQLSCKIQTIWFGALHLIPLRRLLLAWMILHDRLPTERALKKRGIHLASICRLCEKDSKNSQHLLVECDYARFLWHKLGELFHSQIDSAMPV